MLAVADPIPDVRKIAVLRANAIGDFIFALPALAALRAAYPDAEIVLLGRAWHAGFLAGRPGPIDRVVVVPPSRGVAGDEELLEDLAELDRFFVAMRAEKFDLALQLHGGGRHSNPFLRRLGARVTVGLQAADAEPLDRSLPYVYAQHEYLRYLETVALAGAAPVTLEPELIVTDADRREADAVLPAGDLPLVLLHPGAGDPRRRWPADNFAALADELFAAGLQIAVTGGAHEQPLVDAVRAAMSAPSIDLCDRLSLGGLAAALSRARLVVSNDSGPLHLAHAVGAATVGLYWGFNLVTAAPLTRTRHRPLADWDMQCSECGAPLVPSECGHLASVVAAIPVDAVRDAALELLEVS